jgi:hypothetical protein
MAVGAKPYSQLARKMTIIALLVALVPLNLLGAAIYSYFTINHEERVKEELRRLSANRASSLQIFLDERTALLEILVNTAPLDDLLSPGRLQQVLALLNRRSWTFLDVGIIYNNGDHLVYVGPYPLEHKNYKDADWFHQTMTRGVYVSDVFLGLRGVPHFVIAVKKNDGERSWILRATIDSDVFANLVRRAQVGASGDAFIVNREGRYQTPSRFGGTVMDTSDLDLKAVPAPHLPDLALQGGLAAGHRAGGRRGPGRAGHRPQHGGGHPGPGQPDDRAGGVVFGAPVHPSPGIHRQAAGRHRRPVGALGPPGLPGAHGRRRGPRDQQPLGRHRRDGRPHGRPHGRGVR